MIAEAADRVAVMYAGRVAEIGPVAAVVGDPLHPYAKGLMGAIPPCRTRPIGGPDPRRDAAALGDPARLRLQPALPEGVCPLHGGPARALTVGSHRVACHLYDASGQAAA